jgi:hypothetical protein
LLDQLSATLLHQVALDGVVRILATVRSGEEVPDAVTSSDDAADGAGPPAARAGYPAHGQLR